MKSLTKRATKPTAPAPFAAGQRVRYSGYALKHDHWLSCGESGRKAAAKDALDRKTAVRGTVIACEPGRFTAPLYCLDRAMACGRRDRHA